jgi:hypothetical protein
VKNEDSYFRIRIGYRIGFIIPEEEEEEEDG